MSHWFLLLLLAALWSPSFLAIKIGLQDIPPLSLAAARLAIASLLTYGLMRWRGNSLPITLEFWKKFAVMGLFANALPFALLMIGETLASSALAAIVSGFTPVGTAVIAHFAIEGERLRGRTLIGIAMGFVGIGVLFLPALLSQPGGQHDENNVLLGLIAFAVMALSYSVAGVYGRKTLRGYPQFVSPTAQLIAATVLLLPFVLVFEWSQLRVPAAPAFGAALWLGVVATGFAYVVYYRLLEISSATFLSLVTFLLPPFGALIGVIFLGEHLAWNAMVGCGMILAGAGFVRNTEE
ncbi:MAG: DMT family transporter [Chlorobi bacterium]|nr:DMT family transporter [Chlorobiota bacterium]